MASVSLISINIERSKHLDVVSDFILAHRPDVVCMQELCHKDIPYFESLLGTQCVYAPSGRHPADPPETEGMIVGCGIFPRLKAIERGVEYYAGSVEDAESPNIEGIFRNNALILCDLEKDGTTFRVGTTHFTWTPDGNPNDAQRRNLPPLLAVLASAGEIVFTGDFNAPRGGEIFSSIAEKYTDNVPFDYVTSLDINLHRAGKLRPEELADKMVDGLFTTPAYSASDVVLHPGISDHYAITATISRE